MLIQADARALPLKDGCVDCVVTSPPYFGLRDYGHPDQVGLEGSDVFYIAALVSVFREVRRVLKAVGTVWLNVGDSYANGGRKTRDPGRSKIHPAFEGDAYRDGIRPGDSDGVKPKDLLMIPARIALALQADGWYLRSDIIWHKPNPMPESVTDRPTKSHEYLFLLAKQERYYYDAAAIAEPVSVAMLQQMDQGYDGLGLKAYEAAGVQNPSSVKARIIANARKRSSDAVYLQSGPTTQDQLASSQGRVVIEDLDAGDGLRSSGGSSLRESDANEYRGKHRGDREQAAGRRMLKRVAEARAAGHHHDAPFGVTRNKRSVWTVNTQPYAGAHFATMPEALVEPCILAGCPLGGLVFDPFSGSGTVLAVAERLGRRGVGTDLNPAYHALAKVRTAQRGLRFTHEDATANGAL